MLRFQILNRNSQIAFNLWIREFRLSNYYYILFSWNLNIKLTIMGIGFLYHSYIFPMSNLIGSNVGGTEKKKKQKNWFQNIHFIHQNRCIRQRLFLHLNPYFVVGSRRFSHPNRRSKRTNCLLYERLVRKDYLITNFWQIASSYRRVENRACSYLKARSHKKLLLDLR